jgi:hypothetical protein
MVRTMRQDGFTRVPKVRNAHGTRVARRIVCTACGEEDTLHFVPRTADVLCRRCAAQQLGVADPDAGIFPERERRCVGCGTVERTRFTGGEEYRCRDCEAGIVRPTTDRARTAERVGDGKVLRVRGGGTGSRRG